MQFISESCVFKDPRGVRNSHARISMKFTYVFVYHYYTGSNTTSYKHFYDLQRPFSEKLQTLAVERHPRRMLASPCLWMKDLEFRV